MLQDVVLWEAEILDVGNRIPMRISSHGESNLVADVITWGTELRYEYRPIGNRTSLWISSLKELKFVTNTTDPTTWNQQNGTNKMEPTTWSQQAGNQQHANQQNATN